MNLRILGLAYVIAAATVGATTLSAEQIHEPLISAFPPDREVCYGRAYDKAHLAAHPHQKVESFLLLRSLTDDELGETTPRKPESVANANIEWERSTRAEGSIFKGFKAGRTTLDVLVRFRKRSETFKQTVECRKREGVGFNCGVECDGGSFDAEPDGDSILIRQSSSGLRLQSGCSSGDESAPEVRLQPGKDDKSFRLSKLPMSACHAARDAARPEWMRPDIEPLRHRLTAATPLCLKAVEALPASLARRFTAISIEAFAAVPNRSVDDDRPDFKLKVEATTDSGNRVTRTLECRTDDYSFDCNSEHAGLRLTAAPRGAATIRDRYYEGGDITKLFGLKTAKLRPIAFVPAACRPR